MTSIFFCTLANVQYNLFSAYKSYGSLLAVADEEPVPVTPEMGLLWHELTVK